MHFCRQLYVTASFFSRDDHIHGGVIQLIKSGINYQDLKWISDMSIEITCEMTGIFISTYNIILINVYQSPSGNFELFIETINKLLVKINCNSNNVIIGGDFNVHFQLTNDGNADSVYDIFASFGLYPSVQFCTRKNATLDNIFTNSTYNFNVIKCLLNTTEKNNFCGITLSNGK